MMLLSTIRSGRFNLDQISRAFLVDIGFGDQIKKMEEYCGVTYTKWLIRSLSLALFVWIIDFTLVHAFDTNLRKSFLCFRGKKIC